MPPVPEQDLYLGYSAADLARSPTARFFRPDMAPLSNDVREALAIGPVAHELLPPVARAGDLLDDGDWPVETGYTVAPDGSARVFVKTPMPGVTPAMWDWWFAWHGSHAERYKLWHPKAHVHVAWSDGRDDLTHYIGRTSNVVEYVGAGRMGLTIRFVPPASLGLDEARLARDGAVAICARGGIAGTPVETGWLIHHVRPVPGGAEMRSRFWLGGENVRPRGMPGPVGAVLGRAASRLAPLPPAQAADLLVHCAQEMSHLATILPDLHAAFSTGPSA
ncbi:MAG: DAPG hydrolase family protein [Caulobacter sp.]